MEFASGGSGPPHSPEGEGEHKQEESREWGTFQCGAAGGAALVLRKGG